MTRRPRPHREGVCDICGAEGPVYPGVWAYIRTTRLLNLCPPCVARLAPREGDVVRLADVG